MNSYVSAITPWRGGSVCSLDGDGVGLTKELSVQPTPRLRRTPPRRGILYSSLLKYQKLNIHFYHSPTPRLRRTPPWRGILYSSSAISSLMFDVQYIKPLSSAMYMNPLLGVMALT